VEAKPHTPVGTALSLDNYSSDLIVFQTLGHDVSVGHHCHFVPLICFIYKSSMFSTTDKVTVHFEANGCFNAGTFAPAWLCHHTYAYSDFGH